MNRTDNVIIIISTGPGGPDMITKEAEAAIESCDLLFGARRLIETFAPGRAAISPSPLVSGTLEAIERELGGVEGSRIGVLVSGDAGFYSLAKAVTERFGREIVRRIPGVSSIQAAFARIGLDWQDVKTFSAHGRSVDFMADIGGLDRAAILTDTHNTAGQLLSAHPHLIMTHDVWVIERVSLPEERITHVSDESVLEDNEFHSLSVIIFIRHDA